MVDGEGPRRPGSPGPDGPAAVWIFLGLLAVTAFGYRRLAAGWFVADDFRWLEISTLRSTLESFVGPWGHGAAYRPMPRVTYLLDVSLFGFAYPGWILTNVLLHALNAWLLYRVMRYFFATRLEQLCVPLLFCVSPLGQENVAWISGRTHLLCAMFSLLCILGFLAHAATARGGYLVGSLLAFLAALLSYEAAVYVLPLLALAAWARPGSGRPAPPSRSAVAGFAGVLAAYLALRAIALHGATVAFYPERDILWARLGDHMHAMLGMLASSGVGGVVVVALALGGALFPGRTLRASALGAAVFAVGMLPFLVLPGLSYRFLYVAQLGLVLVVASAVHLCARSRRPVPIALAALLCLGAALHSLWRVDAFAKDWVAAGALSRSVPAQIHALYPRQPEGANFYVHGAPVAYASVPLFISYFDSAVRFMYDHYRAFHGVVLNSWELGNRTHLVASLRGQVIHTGAACPALGTILASDFEHLELSRMQSVALACPARYFEFDRATFVVRETSKDRWLELVAAHPGMSVLP